MTSRLHNKPVQADRALKVLLAPVISEKGTFVGERRNQVVFRVLQDATKAEVKVAVESLFNVQVLAVNVVNIQGKAKRTAKGAGRRAGVRKAYVSLKPGQELSFGEAA